MNQTRRSAGELRGSPETREAILDATDHLLATRGFRKVTMDDIAAVAGVSRRTVYMYFPSKEEVGLSSIDRVVENTHRRLQEIAAGAGDPAAILREMLIARVLYRIDSVQPYRQSLDELFEAVRPAYMERRRRQWGREVEIIASVLETGRKRRRLAFDDDATSTAVTLIQATNAFLPYSLSAQEIGNRNQVETGIRRMADLLLKSLTRPIKNSPSI
ncbi:MAG: TetR/AcrR family transcriptional regulator [Polyangiaceae bacterium]|nr:TetR/AcrR family transcriptional regulator [Polyangiaceae bacterium]